MIKLKLTNITIIKVYFIIITIYDYNKYYKSISFLSYSFGIIILFSIVLISTINHLDKYLLLFSVHFYHIQHKQRHIEKSKIFYLFN